MGCLRFFFPKNINVPFVITSAHTQLMPTILVSNGPKIQTNLITWLQINQMSKLFLVPYNNYTGKKSIKNFWDKKWESHLNVHKKFPSKKTQLRVLISVCFEINEEFEEAN